MKSVLLASSVITALVSWSAFAAQYDCQLNSSRQETPLAQYAIDTVTQENVFRSYGAGTFIGCQVFRSSPELLTCGIGKAVASDQDHAKEGTQFTQFATTENGSSLLQLSVTAQDSYSMRLLCVKKR